MIVATYLSLDIDDRSYLSIYPLILMIVAIYLSLDIDDSSYQSTS